MNGITGIEDRLQDEVSDTIMKMTEAVFCSSFLVLELLFIFCHFFFCNVFLFFVCSL